jgi:hypothetical protein
MDGSKEKNHSVTQHINRMKDKIHTIISLETEAHFTKFNNQS